MFDIAERREHKVKGSGSTEKKMTINDVAEHLGVSISTVSRAISGKGDPQKGSGIYRGA